MLCHSALSGIRGRRISASRPSSNRADQNTGSAGGQFSFCTIEPNVGRSPVPDARLDKLRNAGSKQYHPTRIDTFVDIAGLVPKARSKAKDWATSFLANKSRKQRHRPCACACLRRRRDPLRRRVTSWLNAETIDTRTDARRSGKHRESRAGLVRQKSRARQGRERNKTACWPPRKPPSKRQSTRTHRPTFRCRMLRSRALLCSFSDSQVLGAYVCNVAISEAAEATRCSAKVRRDAARRQHIVL